MTYQQAHQYHLARFMQAKLAIRLVNRAQANWGDPLWRSRVHALSLGASIRTIMTKTCRPANTNGEIV